MSSLVSIALCTYNSGRFLTTLLESLLQQSYKNIEIICCDDKSTDDTVKTLKQFKAQYPGIFTIYK
ncbi:MAG: glycosyltransferase, partial [Chitinophagaceae bacterium]|nr:glycosyltransferase [Chitinophagaceae bacterium]